MTSRRIVRTPEGWGLLDGDGVLALRHGLTEMLRGAPIEATDRALPARLLAPVDDQEIWAAGVTYERSLRARAEESSMPDLYDKVYRSERPELFFKASGRRARGPEDGAHIRSDSTWDVPEPELTLVLDADGRIFGFTIGDDVSSRSIEGDNPLYLPQAKIYEGSCVLGPWIVPAADVTAPFDIALTITRAAGPVFSATTSTSKMVRDFEELAQRLVRSMRFPDGVLLLTGTGIVPDESITLKDGDVVTIEIDQIGTLTHEVTTWQC